MIKPRFYYMDLNNYSEDFLKEIILWQKERIEELEVNSPEPMCTKQDKNEGLSQDTHSQETKPPITIGEPEIASKGDISSRLGARDKNPDNSHTKIKNELEGDYVKNPDVKRTGGEDAWD